MALPLPTPSCPHHHASASSPCPRAWRASPLEVREWVSHPPSANANVSPILFLLPAAWGFTMHPLSLWLDVFTNCRLPISKRSEAPRRQAWCHRLSELSSGCGLSAIPMVSCVYLLETIHVLAEVLHGPCREDHRIPLFLMPMRGRRVQTAVQRVAEVLPGLSSSLACSPPCRHTHPLMDRHSLLSCTILFSVLSQV